MLSPRLILSIIILPVFVLLSACSDSGMTGLAPDQPIDDDVARNSGQDPEQTPLIVTDSGLQYEILKQTIGPKPLATSIVTVHYRGRLLDGTEFDSSYSRGEPSTFPLQGVIEGFAEGLQLMSVGSKYRFFLPPNLGYGDRGAPPLIPPDATLEFEIELLEINS